SRLAKLSEPLYMRLTALSEAAAAAKQITDSLKAAKAHRERVFTALNELRMTIDEIELIMSKKHWDIPTYVDILYSV
ncbi:MAG: glutamine synthetase type III, partial [Clostridiales bacterium]|nr:glutamine synthetase type III [Clostridiales bacterium]